MDFSHLVKQLDLEIGHLETQLREKKIARGKLWSLLSQQEQLLLEAEGAPAPPPAKPPKPAGNTPAAPKTKT